jgi:hypothetical protein
MARLANKTFQVPFYVNEYTRTISFILKQLTSLHTNASKGKVVNIFNPNANLAILIKVLSDGKLFRILPT